LNFLILFHQYEVYIPILTEYHTRAVKKNPDALVAKLLVFTSLEGTPVNPQTGNVFGATYCTGQAVVHKNFYALRHPHATKLLASGIAFMGVSHRLGHAKPSPDKKTAG
jgi:site-specific recombinase XerD